MLMSDIIARQIMEMLQSSANGMAEIQRNTLAEEVGCVPSQINYVISSRFTPERGYIVESKRGGGGYIRITEVRSGAASILMHIINSVGASLDMRTQRIITENLVMRDMISEQVGRLIDAATSEGSLRAVNQPHRDIIRAAIFKNMLMSQIKH